MEIKANLNYLRISPRKVRLVANLVKGMNVKQAESELRFRSTRSAEPIRKLLASAAANARNNLKVEDSQKLYIKEIRVGEGPVYKRFMPRAFGRSAVIRKRTSHVSMVLDIKNQNAK